MKYNMDCQEILYAIKKHNTIAITGHKMPDGDSIGSAVALYHLIKQLGKDVYIVLEDSVTEQVDFLLDQVRLYRSTENIKADLLIVLDCGDIARANVAKTFAKDKTIINIDHHVSNSQFADINYINDKSSSVGEMIYNLILVANVKVDIKMAEALFVSISSDTGHFQYSNTSPSTFLMMSKLLEVGINITQLYERLYCNTSKEKLAVLGKAYSNIEYYYENKIALISISNEDLMDCHAKMEDTDGIIATLRDIEDVEVAVFIKQLGENYFKVGLRSRSYINVADISASFGGGGHIRAAGFSMNENLELVKKNIIETITRKFKEV